MPAQAEQLRAAGAGERGQAPARRAAAGRVRRRGRAGCAARRVSADEARRCVATMRWAVRPGCPRSIPTASPARTRRAAHVDPGERSRPTAAVHRLRHSGAAGVDGVDHRRGDVADSETCRGAGGGSGRAPSGSGGWWSAPTRSRRRRTRLRAARSPSSARRRRGRLARRRPSRRVHVRRRPGCRGRWWCGRSGDQWRGRFRCTRAAPTSRRFVDVVIRSSDERHRAAPAVGNAVGKRGQPTRLNSLTKGR